MMSTKNEHRSNDSPGHPLGPDPEFERALDEFAEASRQSLESLFRGRMQALEERIAGLASKANSTEVLIGRALAAEEQVARLQRELAKAKAVGLPATRSVEPATQSTSPPIDPISGAGRRIKAAENLRPNPSLDDVIKFLLHRGFDVDNKRPLGGGLWVYADQDAFETTAKTLQSAGVGVRYHPRGRRLKPDPQFEVDPAKVLET